MYNHTREHRITTQSANEWASHHGISEGSEESGLCMGMLGKVSNCFEGGRISVNWLETNFNKLPDDATEKVIQQCAQAFIMKLIRGILMPNKSRNLVHISLNRCRMSTPRLYLHPAKSVGQSRDVGHEGAVDVYATVEMHELDRVLR
ncbi:hypothetical protein J1N35_025338 [Gossypium stocksii]|uniref:Uncharacterized protein n=1 Tax=Gossypium stocksii TaxID=47602 RepID=A0A9D3V6S1_9ROSI|nr:hypothetical protein J1N35_025338 [Gossypium stocksii]